jgi:5-methylcytosine-specific restriction endonuclease McrBC regulatory subunit McrC
MIRVQNVYYMLAYAFQVLHEQGYKNVVTEEFDNVAELLSAILCRGVSVQIKRGLIRQYISREVAVHVQCLHTDLIPAHLVIIIWLNHIVCSSI